MSVEGRDQQLARAFSRKSPLPPSSTRFKTKLNVLSARTKKIKGEALKTLAHFINKEWLEESWKRLNMQSAYGMDKISATRYAENLSENLGTLLHEMKTGSYRPFPLRRVYIPKDNGKRRPLGLPTIKDKLAQQAVSMILTEIYEQEFLPISYGYRPEVTAHDALNDVKECVAKSKVSWVVDVDIHSFLMK